ncbi:MAG: hypothetical protein ACFB9N_03270 [Geitlerinemataceae cyanobacterium]
MRPLLRSLPATALSSLALAAPTLVKPVQAEPVIYDFTVEVRTGSLAGNSFYGTFRYDDDAIAGTGRETIGVDDGLTVKMRFYGLDFQAPDDVDFPDYPRVNLVDGEIESLDFWIEPGDRVQWWDFPGWDVELMARD